MLTLTDKQYDQLCTRAEARVVWGDAPEEIVESLVQGGFDPGEAKALVGGWVKDRKIEVRSRGVRRLITGSAMLAGAILFFTAMPWTEWVRSMNSMIGTSSRRGIGTYVALAIVVAGLTGFWWMIRGITAVLVPQGQELTDVE